VCADNCSPVSSPDHAFQTFFSKGGVPLINGRLVRFREPNGALAFYQAELTDRFHHVTTIPDGRECVCKLGDIEEFNIGGITTYRQLRDGDVGASFNYNAASGILKIIGLGPMEKRDNY